jgi:hypothetical protein
MIFGSHDPKTLAQLADVATRAHRVALMADGHLGCITLTPLIVVMAGANEFDPYKD